MKTKCSLAHRLGGERVIGRICESLYARALIDDRVAPFYSGLDMNDLVVRQRRFLEVLLDDVKLVQLDSLRRIHQPLVEERGLDDTHFDALKELLDESMLDAGIDVILRNHVLGRMETTRPHVLGLRHDLHFKKETTMMGKFLSAIYAMVAYTVGMGAIAWIALWLINVLVPNGLDAPASGPMLPALAINLVLIGVFALQHSGMARPGFKRWWTQYVPRHLERSTYVLASGIVTLGLCYFWQPMGGLVWQATDINALVIIYTIYALGWALLVMSTFWINHFDLFGLRQVWFYLKGEPYRHVPFQTPGMYQYVRHPLYLGWLTVMWTAPTMTYAHLAFALLATVYIFTAIQWEERDLEQALPEYRRYKRVTPMIIPGTGGESPKPSRATRGLSAESQTARDQAAKGVI